MIIICNMIIIEYYTIIFINDIFDKINYKNGLNVLIIQLLYLHLIIILSNQLIYLIDNYYDIIQLVYSLICDCLYNKYEYEKIYNDSDINYWIYKELKNKIGTIYVNLLPIKIIVDDKNMIKLCTIKFIHNNFVNKLNNDALNKISKYSNKLTYNSFYIDPYYNTFNNKNIILNDIYDCKFMKSLKNIINLHIEFINQTKINNGLGMIISNTNKIGEKYFTNLINMQNYCYVCDLSNIMQIYRPFSDIIVAFINGINLNIKNNPVILIIDGVDQYLEYNKNNENVINNFILTINNIFNIIKLSAPFIFILCHNDIYQYFNMHQNINKDFKFNNLLEYKFDLLEYNEIINYINYNNCRFTGTNFVASENQLKNINKNKLISYDSLSIIINTLWFDIDKMVEVINNHKLVINNNVKYDTDLIENYKKMNLCFENPVKDKIDNVSRGKEIGKCNIDISQNIILGNKLLNIKCQINFMSRYLYLKYKSPNSEFIITDECNNIAVDDIFSFKICRNHSEIFKGSPFCQSYKIKSFNNEVCDNNYDHLYQHKIENDGYYLCAKCYQIINGINLCGICKNDMGKHKYYTFQHSSTICWYCLNKLRSYMYCDFTDINGKVIKYCTNRGKNRLNGFYYKRIVMTKYGNCNVIRDLCDDHYRIITNASNIFELITINDNGVDEII